MGGKYSVRIMRSVIRNFKNVQYGEVPYMNYSSIIKKGRIETTDIVGIYGQNGSGKTALVEALDMLKYILRGFPVPYEMYAGLLSKDEPVALTTDFFIESDHDDKQYKATYTAYLRANDKQNSIELYKECLTYWTRGSAWKSERDIQFENPDYDNADILMQRSLSVESSHLSALKSIPFLTSMQNLALVSAQKCISVFFNPLVLNSLGNLKRDMETAAFSAVIQGIMQFGFVDLNVIKVNQLGTINSNKIIPLHVHSETKTTISQSRIDLFSTDVTEIPKATYDQVQSAITAINIAIKSIIPNLQIELKPVTELEKPDGTKMIQAKTVSHRDGKTFSLRYESEGIKRIISILNYLVSVYNNPGVCLVVDELDSGIFEYLLGEMLGLFGREMKGQLIFTSHNLRILEKLNARNIVCSTINPSNRYIRLVGIEKNNNKRDFYIRAITVGGQKEELYDEDDLIAMGYAFRKAGQANADRVNISFSPKFENKMKNAGS